MSKFVAEFTIRISLCAHVVIVVRRLSSYKTVKFCLIYQPILLFDI